MKMESKQKKAPKETKTIAHVGKKGTTLMVLFWERLLKLLFLVPYGENVS